MKVKIIGMKLYAIDKSGKKIDQFKVVWIGDLAFGEIRSMSSDKQFLELHCERIDGLETENKRLKDNNDALLARPASVKCPKCETVIKSV